VREPVLGRRARLRRRRSVFRTLGLHPTRQAPWAETREADLRCQFAKIDPRFRTPWSWPSWIPRAFEPTCSSTRAVPSDHPRQINDAVIVAGRVRLSSWCPPSSGGLLTAASADSSRRLCRRLKGTRIDACRSAADELGRWPSTTLRTAPWPLGLTRWPVVRGPDRRHAVRPGEVAAPAGGRRAVWRRRAVSPVDNQPRPPVGAPRRPTRSRPASAIFARDNGGQRNRCCPAHPFEGPFRGQGCPADRGQRFERQDRRPGRGLKNRPTLEALAAPAGEVARQRHRERGRSAGDSQSQRLTSFWAPSPDSVTCL
jgi:hypothetical protein